MKIIIQDDNGKPVAEVETASVADVRAMLEGARTETAAAAKLLAWSHDTVDAVRDVLHDEVFRG